MLLESLFLNIDYPHRKPIASPPVGRQRLLRCPWYVLIFFYYSWLCESVPHPIVPLHLQAEIVQAIQKVEVIIMQKTYLSPNKYINQIVQYFRTNPWEPVAVAPARFAARYLVASPRWSRTSRTMRWRKSTTATTARRGSRRQPTCGITSGSTATNGHTSARTVAKHLLRWAFIFDFEWLYCFRYQLWFIW